MSDFILRADSLFRDIEARARELVPDGALVSIQFEPLTDDLAGDTENDIRVLKASSRICFIQGVLSVGETPVLKARAIFRKK